MSSARTEAILAFAGYVLDARRRLLIGADGAPVELSSRAFDTLYYLALHPHEVIDKPRLMKAVWPNSVVEENNLNQQISTLRKVFGETVGEHRFIVTVSGRGYKFVQDVRCVEAPAAVGAGHADRKPSIAGRLERAPARTSWPTAAVGALVLLVGACAYFTQREWQHPAPSQAPSIAVLPFADVSPGHDQEYFADGLSEEVLNALGRLNGLRVIGRTSSFSFKGRNEDVRHVAAVLGVQHVLEGSVRREGDRLRITAQLVDARNGSQLWAETYDETLGDVFAIQKQIADSVASTLQVTLGPARRAALAGGTTNVEAYQAYLAARAVMNNEGSGRSRDSLELLERAVKLDPDFAQAWAALAEGYTFAADFTPGMALSLTPAEIQHRISKAALRALELAPDSPQSLRSAGMVSMQSRDWAEAGRRLRRAAELAGPYDYDTNLLYAMFLMNVGRPTDALPYEERAMRAEPLLMRPVTFMAALHEMRGELDKAEALMEASQNLQGSNQMRKQALLMIRLSHHDRRYVANHVTLADMRESYDEAVRTGIRGQLIPVALFSSVLGDQSLALDALRARGPTQSVFPIWRAALSDVRRQPGFEQLVKDLGLVDYWRASGEWGEFCRDAGDGAVACR